MYKQQNYVPDKDAGWGLIFRLNALWERADRRAEAGDYEGWEVVLDRIFSNLMYRNKVEIVTNGDNEIIDVEIKDEEYKEFQKVKQKIRNVRFEMLKARHERNFKNLKLAQMNLYKILMFYDIWLRKFMQSRDLYLKETEHNPGKALFGR